MSDSSPDDKMAIDGAEEILKINHNENINFEELVMIQSRRATANKMPELFASPKHNKLVRYCQVYEDKILCNFAITYKNNNDLSDRGSERCIHHVKKEHKNVASHKDQKSFLNKSFGPYKKFLNFRKRNRNVIDMVTQTKQSSIPDPTPLQKYLLCLVLSDCPLHRCDHRRMRGDIVRTFPNETIPQRLRNDSAEIVKKRSIIVTEYFKAELKKESLQVVNTPIPLSDSANDILYPVCQEMDRMKLHPPTYVAVNTHVWKRNKSKQYGANFFNFTNTYYDKCSFVADYRRMDFEKIATHKDYLEEVCTNFNAAKCLINTCSDNATNISFPISNLVEDDRYPLYAGHIDCLSDILNSVCER